MKNLFNKFQKMNCHVKYYTVFLWSQSATYTTDAELSFQPQTEFFCNMMLYMKW